VRNYLATRDATWLEAGVKVYDFCIARMRPGPDGYRGFVGEFIYNVREKTNNWCDEFPITMIRPAR
jgi:hypothetical protein